MQNFGYIIAYLITKRHEKAVGISMGQAKRILRGILGTGIILGIGSFWVYESGYSAQSRYEAAIGDGVRYEEMMAYDLAADSYRTALSIREDDYEAALGLIRSLAGEGESESILSLVERKSLSLSVDEWALLTKEASQILLEEAAVLEAKQSTDAAVALYEAVLSLEDENEEAKEALEELYVQQATEHALASFEEILTTDPDNETALSMSAELLRCLGRYEEAIDRYALLLEMDEDNETALSSITRCLVLLAQESAGEEAVHAWQEVLDWDDGVSEAYQGLADAYLEIGSTRKALQALEEGISATGSEELEEYLSVLCVSSFERLVLEIIEDITTQDMTQDEKRLACYQYIIDNTEYVRSYDTPEGDWTKQYAFDVLSYGEGNCYRYAAAFAYMCRALGYEVKVCTGQIQSSQGGTTPHGWTVLSIDGVEYICDPDMEQAKERDFYMKTFEEYSVKPLITEEEWEIGF